MGRLEGKVALITGAGRGQGRSHAELFANEGADIVALDLAPTPERDDLAGTAEVVRAAGRRVVTAVADVRDQTELDAAVEHALERFGHIDIVIANAGISPHDSFITMSDDKWTETIDVNLSGCWRTIKAVAPSMIAAGTGGSVVITSSVAGLRGGAGAAALCSSKHGQIGLMRSLANELGPHNIRVNCVNPGFVDTEMSMQPAVFKRFCPDLENPTRDDVAKVGRKFHVLPTPWIDSIDVSYAALWLASDESRFVTGLPVVIDAGQLIK